MAFNPNQDGPSYTNTYNYNDPETPQPYVDPTTKFVAKKPANPNDPTADPNMPAGIDPALWAIYQNAGVTPAGRGTGFADWQYWQDAGPSQYGRLTSDIAGTGTDQSTGTPWAAGAWQGSGVGAHAAPAPSSGSGGGLNLNVSGVNGAFLSNPQGVSDQLIQQLQQRAQQSLNIDPTTDSVIAPQVAAFGAQQEQARRSYLDNLAESSGPYASGAVQGANERTSEQAGQATAGMQAQLVGNELQARRTDIQNALTEQGGLLTANQQLTLQGQLGSLDEAIKQLSVNNQNTQFGQSLALSTDQLNNYWNAIYGGLITG